MPFIYGNPPRYFELNDNPGLLPYKIGNAQLTNNKWSFIQIFDLNGLIDNFDAINKQYDSLKSTLSNSILLAEFNNSYLITDNLKQKIEEQFYQIFPMNNRVKRGLINGLGSIIKTITGNLDQEDAHRIEKNIKVLRKNQYNLKFAIIKQTSLLNDSINTFQNLVKNISKNQNALYKQINNVIIAVNSITNKEMKYVGSFKTYVVLMQITTFYQSIYDTFAKIEIAITFAKLNTFHNAIVSTGDLLNELKLINTQLSSSKLPFEPTIENKLKLKNALEISSFVKNKEIVFVIEIPLVEKEKYDLYQLFPLFVKHDQYFKTIIPNFDYVLINDYKYGHSHMPCKRIINDDFLCNHIQCKSFITNVPCEIQLLRYSHNVTDCNVIFSKIDNVEIQNIDNNKWVLTTNTEIIASEVCEKSQPKVLLKGTNLIELTSKCQLKVEDIMLKTYNNIKHNYESIPLPHININISNKNVYNNVKLLNLNNVHFEKLNELQKEISLQKIENSRLLHTNPIYYSRTSIWTVLLYVFLCLIIMYLLFKYLRPIIQSRKKDNKKNNEIII